MDITIMINTDNAAFEDDPGAEVARILRNLAKEVDGITLDPGDYANLRDSNGNTVGKCTVSESSKFSKVSADELADTIASLLNDAPKPPKSIKHRYTFTYNLARATLNRYRVGV
jgi:hypothetical protein